MTKMKALLICATMIMSPQAHAEDYAMGQRMAKWNNELVIAQRPGTTRPVFHCSYTTRTCVRGYSLGYRNGGSFDVLQVLDDKDRETVLEHLFCSTSYGFTGNPYVTCNHVESGMITVNGKDNGTW